MYIISITHIRFADSLKFSSIVQIIPRIFYFKDLSKNHRYIKYDVYNASLPYDKKCITDGMKNKAMENAEKFKKEGNSFFAKVGVTFQNFSFFLIALNVTFQNSHKRCILLL